MMVQVAPGSSRVQVPRKSTVRCLYYCCFSPKEKTIRFCFYGRIIQNCLFREGCRRLQSVNDLNSSCTNAEAPDENSERAWQSHVRF